MSGASGFISTKNRDRGMDIYGRKGVKKTNLSGLLAQAEKKRGFDGSEKGGKHFPCPEKDIVA